MKITAIKQQLKNTSRYSVFLDGKYSFSVSDVQLLDLKLHTGQELDKSELGNLKKLSDEGKLLDKVLNYLSYRPRSEWEIRDYLKRKKTIEQTADKVIKHLRAKGFLNDEQFARAWVANRRLLKFVSKRKLRAELAAKRVSPDIIDQVVNQDETDEQTVLKELIAKKAKRYPDKQKFMAYLARQGFNYGDIKVALDEKGEEL